MVLALDPVPIDETDPAVYHKTTNRYGYDERLVRVRGVGDKTVDDVVMVNARGVVTETTIANIAVLIGGRWVTPPRTDGLLAGTLRNRLVALGDLTERSITVADLGNAEAVAVVNSVRGWRPAVVVDP
ncbi:MAG: aminotransferase class IV [Acidimicrobiia bacterium]|nr:aminotransferase class IV [Acidimicrobiia bacterium]